MINRVRIWFCTEDPTYLALLVILVAVLSVLAVFIGLRLMLLALVSGACFAIIVVGLGKLLYWAISAAQRHCKESSDS